MAILSNKPTVLLTQSLTHTHWSVMRPRAKLKRRPFARQMLFFARPPRGTCWAPVELEQSVLLTRIWSEFLKCVASHELVWIRHCIAELDLQQRACLSFQCMFGLKDMTSLRILYLNCTEYKACSNSGMLKRWTIIGQQSWFKVNFIFLQKLAHHPQSFLSATGKK